MAIKKKVPNSKKKGGKISKTKEKIEIPQGLCLPSKKKGINDNLSDYTILIYGREKIGKSTIFSGFPKALFFSTEPGTKGLDIYEFNADKGGITNWAIFRAGVELLVKNPKMFKTIIIDTVDMAYEMCLDWVCRERGIEYPGVDASGSEDYGKSWKAVKQEFTEQIHRLSQAGLGIGFVSHAKEQEIRTRFGDRYTRIFPSMSGQARTVVEALVDFFFYADYVKQTEERVDRILICQGDETIWAGARSAGGRQFPRLLPMLHTGTYGLIEDAFRGLYKGLDPEEVFPTKATTKTAQEFLKKERVAAKRKGGEKRSIAKIPKRKVLKKKK